MNSRRSTLSRRARGSEKRRPLLAIPQSHGCRLDPPSDSRARDSRRRPHFADFPNRLRHVRHQKFDPWRQKTIYEYTRRDAPDSYEFPKPLFDFFLQQVDKYAGASDATLQRLRYLREAVMLRAWTPEQAAQDALKKRDALTKGPEEDRAALNHFAVDMRSESAP